jgi:hypothetical protein
MAIRIDEPDIEKQFRISGAAFIRLKNLGNYDETNRLTPRDQKSAESSPQSGPRVMPA